MLGKGLESLIPQLPDEPGDNSSAPKEGNFPAGSSDWQHSGVAKNKGGSPPASQARESQAASPAQAGAPLASGTPAGNQNFPSVTRPAKKENSIEAVFHIEIEKIKPNPFQPRRVFSEEALRELASSIREFGLIQPIVVSKIEKEVPGGTDVEYQLIAGERRWLASKILGLERIPAIVKNVDLEKEKLELAIIENIQRENLNPIEKARAFARLQEEFRLTQREVAARLGKSRESVANIMRLLGLSQPIQEALEKGNISESHGRLLLTIEDPGLQEKFFRELLENRLTTREFKNKVRFLKNSGSGNESGLEEEISPELKMLQEKLSSDLSAPVEIRQKGENGRITISFYSREELENIIRRLQKEGF